MFADALPAFPWDSLRPYQERARAHPGGMVDLSVGTPVDPTPAVAQEALRQAADSPGYPATIGTPDLRSGIVRHYARRRHVDTVTEAGVLPTIGSKEAVALLPSLLGLEVGDAVAFPAIAYPTYDVGARLAGAEPVRLEMNVDGLERLEAKRPDLARRLRLIWVNSPANPHGAVTGADQLRGIVSWARRHGAVVAADECYAELPWVEPYVSDGVPSLLDARVSQGDTSGLLALYSLSKQSNAAGYRAAWVAGDPDLVTRLAETRKHIGMMVPAPVQAAMLATLEDDLHVRLQREVYGRRRAALAAALEQAGYVITASHAGLYFWYTTANGQDAWQTVGDLADLGILVAPGHFYGPGGKNHVRMALTGSDVAVADAANRLLAA